MYFTIHFCVLVHSLCSGELWVILPKPLFTLFHETMQKKWAFVDVCAPKSKCSEYVMNNTC